MSAPSPFKRISRNGLTYDDVLLVPNYSEVLPREVDLSVNLTPNLKLNIPILSAAMDTISEKELALELAKEGGMAVVHKNMSIEEQANQIKWVKDAKVDKNSFPNAALDKYGQAVVGAAVGVTPDTLDRVSALVEAGVNIIAVDTAHGHSAGVLKMIAEIRKLHPDLAIIGGNIATKSAAKALAEAGANVVKVGVGPGSICTTRVVTGVGVPQLSAVMEVAEYCMAENIGLIADGGIKLTGDIPKALAGGADVVMLGSMFAGVDESPGDLIREDGKTYKEYRGMGSLGAMQKGSKDRYFQDAEDDIKKLVPEGIEARVEGKGPLKNVVHQMVGGLRAAMGYVGAKDCEALKKAEFVKISTAAYYESHPHSVQITQKAPNY